MASRKPGPADFNPLADPVNCKTPGPLGMNDYADPSSWLSQGGCQLGDTPGPLGVGDHADPFLGTKIGQPIAAAAPAPAAAAAPAAGPLQVSQGQVTFDAEGNDISTSPYYSRVISWPGTALSGVTLGRGYDMGGRTEAGVAADLVAAGMAQDKADEFAKGAGKKGDDAKKFVADNKEKLGEITQEVQKKLFENIYPTYVESAKANYDKWTKGDDANPLAGKVEWDKLEQAIRDILVDFVYQGFTKGPNPMVKGMKNDFDELIDYINDTPALKQYEAGRKRVDYLKARKKKE